jgi:hypothetical protein
VSEKGSREQKACAMGDTAGDTAGDAASLPGYDACFQGF